MSTGHALAGPCFVGFDLGTSGARVSVIDADTKEIFSESIRWKAYDDANAWEDAIYNLLGQAKDSMGGSLEAVKSICVSGTSASCLMVDEQGEMTRSPRMYDFDVTAVAPYGEQALKLLDKFAPPQHTARAKTSSFAKLLTWGAEKRFDEGEALCHQADYIIMKLMREKDKPRPAVCSDWHNCLKCGYDVRNLEWPSWVEDCLKSTGAATNVIPSKIVSPGEPLGVISQRVADKFGLKKDTALVGGTTDSNAAFFAAVGGTRAPMGTAVVSLGSTLAIKQLSSAYVEDASRGVYSHRFPGGEGGETWLIGGASNVGCAVLRQQDFSDDELIQLSKEIDPMSDSDLTYYPLTKKGERFPVADSEKEPLLDPVPKSRGEFLHGILQGISHVERDGFEVLGELGASPRQPVNVMTCGGGSKNDMWTKMRQRKLASAFNDDDISVERAENTEASFGAAILAASTFLE